MQINITLDQDGSGKEWDRIEREKKIPMPGTCNMVTKANATAGGKAAVMLVFPVVTDAGVAGFPVVFTAREFVMMAAAVEGCHPGCGDRDPDMLHGKLPEKITASYRGVGYDAIAVERVYLVSCEARSGQLSIAGSKQEVETIAKRMIDEVLGDG